jgi:hypothetical protein
MPSLIQTLLGSLLDSPIVESIACKAGEKAITTIRAHFTFSAQQMSTAYQDSYGYTLVAISVGVTAPDQKLSLAQKIFNSKISREFAEQIDRHYLQPFAKQYGLSNQDLPAFRLTAAQSLKDFAKHKDKIFQIEQITDDDLIALISYRDTSAITDLVLEQMQHITPVDDTLAAFLRHDGQLGDGVLFFFRELIRKDDRLEKNPSRFTARRFMSFRAKSPRKHRTSQSHTTKLSSFGGSNRATITRLATNPNGLAKPP